MAMVAPAPKLGVDPTRSGDILDDIVNVVRPHFLSFAPQNLYDRLTRLRSPSYSPPYFESHVKQTFPQHPVRYAKRSCARGVADSPRLSQPPEQVDTYVADGFDAFEE
jgi:hypothetical protein